MNIKTKGNLIEAFIEKTSDLLIAEKKAKDLSLERDKIALLIASDEELYELVMNGGVYTYEGSLLTLNKDSGKLVVNKVISSYTVNSELTAEQLEVLEDGK